MTKQLISYIALGAPATRRQTTEKLPWLRPEIGFTPKWFNRNTGIDFGENYHSNPVIRKEAHHIMRNEIDRRFPGNRIGKMDLNELSTDLLTGVFGACTIAAMFGIPVRFYADQWPVTEHNYLTDSEIYNLKPAEPSNNPFFTQLLQQVEEITLLEEKTIGFINWQGILNNAQRLRGPQIFTDMLTEPEMTRHLLSAVCQTMIDSCKLLQEKQKDSGFEYQFFTISNCLVNMLSPELYEEFILPCDQRIASTFQSVGIHNCAWTADPYLDSYASIKNLSYLDMGKESDLRKAQTLFPLTRRAIMYTPMDLAEKPLADIRADMERIARFYGPCDIVAADIEYGTPDEKVIGLMKICREISLNFEP